jgi:hypothetical protein
MPDPVSLIREIHANLVTLVASAVPSYRQLPNPYAVSENTFLHLTGGFGLAIGPGLDTERLVGCKLTYQRAFTLVLVRKLHTTQNNTERREGLELDILEDHDSVRKAIYHDSTLGGKVLKTILADDGGLNFIDGDKFKFLSMEMNIVTEYLEGV